MPSERDLGPFTPDRWCLHISRPSTSSLSPSPLPISESRWIVLTKQNIYVFREQKKYKNPKLFFNIKAINSIKSNDKDTIKKTSFVIKKSLEKHAMPLQKILNARKKGISQSFPLLLSFARDKILEGEFRFALHKFEQSESPFSSTSSNSLPFLLRLSRT